MRVSRAPTSSDGRRDPLQPEDPGRRGERAGGPRPAGRPPPRRHGQHQPGHREVHRRNIRIGRSPYFIAGESAEGDKNEVTVHNATVTYREPGAWQPTVRAKTLIWSPGHYLKLAGGEHGPRRLPAPADLPHGPGPGARPADHGRDGRAGYRKNLGLWVDTAFNLPVTLGASVGPDLGVYTNRGVMIGPVAAYDVTSGDDTAVGYLKSGYIYDYGKRYTDILGAAVPPNRAYAEWVHNQQVTPDLSITGDINWSTDSEVIRDFHSKEFIPVQEPDNYLESVYTGPDFLASVFARFQPDSFYPVQQRLPEIRFDVLPTPLGGGILVRFNSGVAHLVEDPPPRRLPPGERPARRVPRPLAPLHLQGHRRLHAGGRRPVHRILGHGGRRETRRHRTGPRGARVRRGPEAERYLRLREPPLAHRRAAPPDDADPELPVHPRRRQVRRLDPADRPEHVHQLPADHGARRHEGRGPASGGERAPVRPEQHAPDPRQDVRARATS
jgi:hypothetical protein